MVSTRGNRYRRRRRTAYEQKPLFLFVCEVLPPAAVFERYQRPEVWPYLGLRKVKSHFSFCYCRRIWCCCVPQRCQQIIVLLLSTSGERTNMLTVGDQPRHNPSTYCDRLLTPSTAIQCQDVVRFDGIFALLPLAIVCMVERLLCTDCVARTVQPIPDKLAKHYRALLDDQFYLP